MPRLMAKLRKRLNPLHTILSPEVTPDSPASPDIVLYVVGGGPSHRSAARDFPLVNRRKGESKSAHLERVVQLVAAARAAGGTHLLVPREQADWLGDHPLVSDYFAEHHELVDANDETGIVFALHSGDDAHPR
jgi:hypothetical protein